MTVTEGILYTPQKTNIDTHNDGLENVSPFNHGFFWVSILDFMGVLPIYQCGSPWWGVRSSEIAGSCFWVDGAQWKGWGSRSGLWRLVKMVAKPLGWGPLNYQPHIHLTYWAFIGYKGSNSRGSNWLWLAQSIDFPTFSTIRVWLVKIIKISIHLRWEPKSPSFGWNTN